FIPKMEERHPYRGKTNEAYLQLLQKLYQLEQKTDILERTASIYAHLFDSIQPSLLVNMAKTYYQLGLSDKGDQSLKDMLVHLSNAPTETRHLGGRVFKPLYKHIDPATSGNVLCSMVSELIALEPDPFRQAMFMVEFLRGAKEEEFSFGAASAERLIEGLDQNANMMARSIGRAAIVEHIELIPEARHQILRQAWDLIKPQDFDSTFRDQVFWSLPLISQYDTELAQEIFSDTQPKIQALPSKTEKEDWHNSILWAISQAPITDWGYQYTKELGEGATENMQSQIAHSVERWSKLETKIESIVSLLEISALLNEPLYRALAISGIVGAAARIGEWDYAFSWIKHIKLYYYKSLAYIEMMIAYRANTAK
ncbi:MAG: hypothetical protein AAFN10_27860, partial [Bacteroidota bacterium]